MAAPAPDRPAAAAAAARADFDVRATEVEPALAARGLALACRPGCAHCCHAMVSVLPQEAFAIAEWIDALDPAEAAALRARILAHARAQTGKGAAERRAAACPCLDPATRLCRIHPARPLTCRGMNSTDEGACRRALETGDDAVPIPTALAPHRIVQDLYDRLGAALAAEGRPAASLEFAAALAAIWEGPDAATLWRRGEDPFAACRAADLAGAPIPRIG